MFGSNAMAVANLAYEVSHNTEGQHIKILDVGVGFGSLAQNMVTIAIEAGELVEYESHDPSATSSYLNKDAWRLQFHGIEANKEFEGSLLHQFYYQNVDYCLASEFIAQNPDAEFDIAVASDVLEHMPMADALALLDYLEKRSKFVIVCVPTFFYTAKGGEISKYEDHVCHFPTKVFLDRGYNLAGADTDGNIFVLTANQN